MKNTVRIHRYGGKKAPSSKVKTRHRQAAKDTVRIAIHDAAGASFADFELPRSSFAALRRDAITKGVTLSEWIESAVRMKFAVPQPRLEVES